MTDEADALKRQPLFARIMAPDELGHLDVIVGASAIAEADMLATGIASARDAWARVHEVRQTFIIYTPQPHPMMLHCTVSSGDDNDWVIEAVNRLCALQQATTLLHINEAWISRDRNALKGRVRASRAADRQEIAMVVMESLTLRKRHEFWAANIDRTTTPPTLGDFRQPFPDETTWGGRFTYLIDPSAPVKA